MHFRLDEFPLAWGINLSSKSTPSLDVIKEDHVMKMINELHENIRKILCHVCWNLLAILDEVRLQGNGNPMLTVAELEINCKVPLLAFCLLRYGQFGKLRLCLSPSCPCICFIHTYFLYWMRYVQCHSLYMWLNVMARESDTIASEWSALRGLPGW